jgi:hypothetical protein
METLTGIGMGHLLSRRFDEAISVLRVSLEQFPHFAQTYRYLASAYAHSGQVDEARRIVTRYARSPGWSYPLYCRFEIRTTVNCCYRASALRRKKIRGPSISFTYRLTRRGRVDLPRRALLTVSQSVCRLRRGDLPVHAADATGRTTRNARLIGNCTPLASTRMRWLATSQEPLKIGFGGRYVHEGASCASLHHR